MAENFRNIKLLQKKLVSIITLQNHTTDEKEMQIKI